LLSDSEANGRLLKVSQVVFERYEENTIVLIFPIKLCFKFWSPIIIVVVRPFANPLTAIAMGVSHPNKLLLITIFVINQVEGQNGVGMTLNNTIYFFIISSFWRTSKDCGVILIETQHFFEKCIFVFLLVVLESFRW